MSRHERERLSAYLDGELEAAERAEVAAHLEACAECAERLAALTAADEAVAVLPADAPRGYFEAFPGRVRARLEPKPVPRQLPTWTWALAAALVVAVVTPLMLRRVPDAALPVPPREAQAASGSARPAAPPAPAAQAPKDAVSRDDDALAPAPAVPVAERQAAAKAETARERESLSAPADRQNLDAGLADAPREPARRIDQTAGFAAMPAPRPAAAREPAAVPAPTAGAASAAVATHDEQPLPSTQEAPARDRAATSEGRETDARAPTEAAAAAPAAASADAATERKGGVRAQSAGTAAGRPAAAARVAPEAEWQRLEAARPRSPEGWRRLREDCRGFVARDPDGSFADAARVRMVEAGLAAWRGSDDPADEAALRADAAAYLARAGAPGKDRVRELLAELPAR